MTMSRSSRSQRAKCWFITRAAHGLPPILTVPPMRSASGRNRVSVVWILQRTHGPYAAQRRPFWTVMSCQRFRHGRQTANRGGSVNVMSRVTKTWAPPAFTFCRPRTAPQYAPAAAPLRGLAEKGRRRSTSSQTDAAAAPASAIVVHLSAGRRSGRKPTGSEPPLLMEPRDDGGLDTGRMGPVSTMPRMRPAACASADNQDVERCMVSVCSMDQR